MDDEDEEEEDSVGERGFSVENMLLLPSSDLLWVLGGVLVSAIIILRFFMGRWGLGVLITNIFVQHDADDGCTFVSLSFVFLWVEADAS